MKKKFLVFALCFSMVLSCMASPITALADVAVEEKNIVVTIGADLTDEQEATMFKLFNVEKDKVKVLEVTNADERKFLEGVASDDVIGKRTFSCSCIEETEEGTGINVMILNLSWATSYMISSALTTAGIYNCNVICASPIEVSGTGALTGVMMAYEEVTGEALDEEKKELATEELVVTGTIAEEIGQDAATGIITDIKETIIADEITDEKDIEEVIEEKSDIYQVTLTDEQVEMITDTMVKVAEQKYDYEALKGTFDNITSSAQENLGIVTENIEEAKGFFASVGDFFKGIGTAIGNFFKGIGGLFGGDKDKDEENTDNAASKDEETTEDSETTDLFENIDSSVLGDDVIINSTDGESVTPSPDATKDPADDETNADDEANSDKETTADDSSDDTTSTDTDSSDSSSTEGNASQNSSDSQGSSDETSGSTPAATPKAE